MSEDQRDNWPMWHCQECGDEMRYYDSKNTDTKVVCVVCHDNWKQTEGIDKS